MRHRGVECIVASPKFRHRKVPHNQNRPTHFFSIRKRYLQAVSLISDWRSRMFERGEASSHTLQWATAVAIEHVN